MDSGKLQIDFLPGMDFIPIPAGKFLMGEGGTDDDEFPPHSVRITAPFHIAATPVTNLQYELFDPAHRNLRGTDRVSYGDREAVCMVSYNEAEAFCRWLSLKSGKPCRLPTEAEWEYVCRGGTVTRYSTGETLPESMLRNQKNTWNNEPVPLEVGVSAPNPFGVYDMHGLMEEWCLDWYGPYPEDAQTDPVGYAEGDFRVTRGGSHNADLSYLRSASRMAALPGDRMSYIGFRVVIGELPKTAALVRSENRLWQRDVRAEKYDWPCTAGPVFSGPIPYIDKEAAETRIYKHNHCPSIVWCDNGDLLAVWFSCESEAGREMTILASRLRRGSGRWDAPSEFYKVPDRNMTGSSLFRDHRGSLVYINGVDSAYGWGKLVMILRTSDDNGVSWSRSTLINPVHRYRNQPISGGFVTSAGVLMQACDAAHGGEGGTALHQSFDGGRTWIDYGYGMPVPDFSEGKTGAWIAGIHAGVAELDDGSLLAYGRGNDIGGRMPESRSTDGGKTWTYRASPFPRISSGQRLVLMKLRNGALLLVSFTDRSDVYRKRRPEDANLSPEGMDFTGENGEAFRGDGMFAALSYDGGGSWPVKKLLTNGSGARVDGGGWTGVFTMDRQHAEPMGYLAATETPDDMIHLLSSMQYYRFNTEWLKLS